MQHGGCLSRYPSHQCLGWLINSWLWQLFPLNNAQKSECLTNATRCANFWNVGNSLFEYFGCKMFFLHPSKHKILFQQSFHEDVFPSKNPPVSPSPLFYLGTLKTPGVFPQREPQLDRSNQVGTLQVSSPPWITWSVSVASATSFDGIGWIFSVYKRWKWTARPWRKVDSILGETHYWDPKPVVAGSEIPRKNKPPLGCIKKPL